MEELTASLTSHRWGSEEPGQPWLGFDETGRLFGTDGCNRLMGEWTLSGDRIGFGPLVSTMMFCQGVDTWLNGATSARCLGDRLEVRNAAGVVIGDLERTQPRSTA